MGQRCNNVIHENVHVNVLVDVLVDVLNIATRHVTYFWRLWRSIAQCVVNIFVTVLLFHCLLNTFAIGRYFRVTSKG